ncbi:MAG: DUF1592 domain-containing protein, partial [Verrucomicrobiota bacterium]
KSPTDFSTWELVYQRVKDGEMPPKQKDRPEAKELKTFLADLRKPLVEVDRAMLASEGRVHGRRLTRVEYEHTLHDLLRIGIPLSNLLPSDEVAHGFETEADQQQLSHFHLDKYLAAADTALDHAFERAQRGDESFAKTFRAKELTQRFPGNYRGPESRDGKTITWRMNLQFVGRMPRTTVPKSGWYRVSVNNFTGINAGKDGAVWGSLRSGACSSNEPILYYVGSVEATSKPRSQSFVAWIQEGHMLEFRPNEGDDRPAPTGANGGNVSYKGRNLAKDGFAGIAFDSISIERVYPHGKLADVRESIWPGVKLQKGKPMPGAPKQAIDRLTRQFASRAFRRPVTEEQIQPYLDLALSKLETTGDFATALKTGYRAILCSPRFLSFVEPVGKLDDHALASRMSYLFWSSMPDWTLRKLANEGKLSDPKVRHAEVERLLGDPKSERFFEHFTDQWLNLKQIDFTTPDSRRFKTFDPIVQDSMVQETRAFFAELVQNNLSVTNFIDSEFGMLDTRLAHHYGMDFARPKPGGGLQRVSLPEKARSGIVTQGSVLKVTADGSVTSPILRGIWVNERILGLKTPPPPPNVPAVEPDIRGAVSIRDQLAKHSASKTCAGCHAKIDPAGFALETYDPVGRWRSAYGTDKKAAKVDPSGVTPDGVEFAGIASWKEIYMNRPEMLTRAFAKHVLTYGTGAYLRFSDADYLDQIVDHAGEKNFGLRSILHACIASPIFLNK